MSILLEWLGEGGTPVPQELAESRAYVCLHGGPDGGMCPENVEPKWWERMTKEPVAKAIREHLAIKHGMGVKVSNEDSLGICAICGCCNPLKVFVPIEHIRDHTTENELWKFPGHCWIRKELNK